MKDLRVLVVEDSPEAMKLLTYFLSDLGIDHVHPANCGRDALTFLDLCGEMIDVVLCDWKMPDMSGLDVLKQIRGACMDIPFLMVTGSAGITDVSLAKSHGVTAYIKKPYSRDELAKKLSVVARLVRANNPNRAPGY
ncbi:MAG: response regulator [Parvibaculum sp.]|nr:response regulator [Parvibaculum sp.]